ncbi:MAG: hypothetical protein ACI4RR_06550, partial [Eubacterium sp.]
MEGKHGKRISRGEISNSSKIKFNDTPQSFKSILLIILILIPIVQLFTPLNNDIWFILNYGRTICTSGIPKTDLFTMHEGFNLVIQQWLSDIIYWKAYSLAGDIGLKLIVMICNIYAGLMLFKLCMQVSKNNFFISYFTSLAASAMLLGFVFTTRPQTFTVCIFITELYFYEKYMSDSRWKYLIPIPLLSLLLINLHASMWLLQFVLLLPFLVNCIKFDFKIIKSEGAKILPLIVNAIISFAVGFINPYGIKAITYVFTSYGVSEINEYINEMKPLNVNSFNGIFAAVLMFALILLNFKTDKHGKIDSKPRYLLLVLGFGFMMFSNIRNVMLFFSCALFTSAYCLRNVNPSIKFEQKTDNKKRTALLAVLFIAALGLTVFLFTSDDSDLLKTKEKSMDINPNANISESKEPYEYTECEGATEFILENYPDADKYDIYTSYDDGGYLEFYGLHTYIDPRAEIFLKANNGREDIFIEYYYLQRGKVEPTEFLNKYNFDLLVVKQDYDIL